MLFAQKSLITLDLSRAAAGGVGYIVSQVFQQAQTAATFSTSVYCRARGLVHMDGEFKVCNNSGTAVTPIYPFLSSPLFEDRISAVVIYFAVRLCTYLCSFSNKVIKILFLMKYSYPKKSRKCNKHALGQINTTMLSCK